MKRIVTLFIGLFLFSIIAKAETVKPTHDVKIIRYVENININGQSFWNVECKMTASYSAVKMVVKDSRGKVVYRHTFSNSYLYIFSNGQIQIGRPNLDWVVLWSKDTRGRVFGEVNEREGVYK